MMFSNLRNLLFLQVLCIYSSCNPSIPQPVKETCETCPTTGVGPNVIIFLADDLGEEIFLNHLDELENISFLRTNGIDFTNCYSNPVCTPSRVELLTGQYPFRTGWDDILPVDGSSFVSGQTSLVKKIKDVGYRTAVVGKWHLSRPDMEPLHYKEFGFDYSEVFFQADGSTSRYWNPTFSKNGVKEFHREKYGPDVTNQYAIELIESSADPFFLYYSFNLPHFPFVSPPPYAPWKYPTDNDAYLAMVKYLDKMIGNVLESLIKSGKIDNTIILFTTDNGTPRKISSQIENVDVVGGKGSLYELGVNVPMYWYESGIVPKVVTHPVDFADIIPSILHRVTGSPPNIKDIDGRSFIGLMEGGELHKPIVYSQYQDSWMLRYQNLKFYERFNKKWIHDVTDDPFELKSNVVENDSIFSFFQNYYDSITNN